MKNNIISAICIGALVGGCSSVPNLPDSYKLGTTKQGTASYYYCESCPAPTKLSKQVYKPLEPDEPVIVNHPVATPEVVKVNHHKKRRKIKHKPIKKPTKKSKPSQCLVWSK